MKIGIQAEQPTCGQWHLKHVIGQGAYGVVYFAESQDGIHAAVKVCRRDAIGDERYARELRGAKLYSAISPHEGLVHLMEFVEEEWGFYCVMELADNEFVAKVAASAEYRPKTLASVIDGEKALPLDECVKLGIALAKGLETLQRHHLLHRDIKPGNVLYVGGCPVLSDPGLVIEAAEAKSLVGTPGYVPPENFTDAASDIYSLGLTLKAASFGRRVEDLDKGPSLEADTGARHFPAWWRIVNKATDPTPSRRYQSAKAFLKDLENLRKKIRFASLVSSSKAKAAIALAVVVAFVLCIVLAYRWRTVPSSGDIANIVEKAEESAMRRIYKNSLRDTFESWSEERLDAEVDKFISKMKNERPSHGKSGTNAADVDIFDFTNDLNDLLIDLRR